MKTIVDIEEALSPLPRMRSGYFKEEGAANDINICGDVPTSQKEACIKEDGSGRTTGPIKTEIIRCPVCNSSNVHLGIKTIWGIPICCRSCGHFKPTRRNVA